MNRDLLRQIWVSVSAVLCVYGTLLGIGVIGTRVEESSGGALAADATLLAPGGPAFSIWSVIYLGLFSYTVWQWLPANKTAPRARAVGWLAGVSMLLNAAWLLVTQVGWIWVSVAVIAILALTLGLIVRRLTTIPATGLVERVVVDGTFGAYLGWVSVATCANVAAAGDNSGWSFGALADQVVAVVVIAAAAGLGVLFAQQFGGRLAIAGAAGWGLAWIAVARLTDAPDSTLVGVAAIVAALLVVAAALLLRRHAPVGGRIA
ncbi:tryptophan-rich sensory protein [Tessaracoccus lubricantis]|uniref:Tryptophan-rich sensory protein n=1 Tax=Tessaracoccus lubricantis TaxID=545543 RepID=A0ABP9FCM9_9ACTN